MTQVSQVPRSAEILAEGAAAEDSKLVSVSDEDLQWVIKDAAGKLRDERREDGHWLFELEADVTIPAEYVLLNHFVDEIDDAVEARLATYIRSRQGARASRGRAPRRLPSPPAPAAAR